MGAGNSAPLGSILPYLIAVNIVVGLVISYAIWAFRSGRWVEEQTRAHDGLQQQIDTLKVGVGDVKASADDEHALRRDLNVALGKVSQEIARHDERIKALDKVLDKLVLERKQ